MKAAALDVFRALAVKVHGPAGSLESAEAIGALQGVAGALEMAQAEMTTLISRVSEPYRSNLQTACDVARSALAAARGQS